MLDIRAKTLSHTSAVVALCIALQVPVWHNTMAFAAETSVPSNQPSAEALVEKIKSADPQQRDESLVLLEQQAPQNERAAAALGNIYSDGKVLPKDLTKALKFFSMAYEKGNLSVAGKLGNLYYRSASALNIDQAKAVGFYQKGADAGDAWAMAGLADVYREGKIVPKDLGKALALYNQALEKGNSSVVAKIGDLYYRNAADLGLDQGKALDFYQKGADAGDAWAMASLADVYRDGKILPKDLPKALSLYTASLEKGNSGVVGKLGDLYYRNGADLGVDQIKALDLYQQAADAGDAWAMASLGDVYREGKIVPKDLSKALSLYTAALEKGNTGVIGKLGDLYYRSAADLGVDQSKALGFYQQAADEGNAWAMASLADVYRDGKIVPVDLAKALALYKEALEKGNASVAPKIANLYYRNGPELNVPPQEAVALYQKGVDAGDPWSMSGLADIYREGKVVPQDINKAYVLYAEALAKGNSSVLGKLGSLYYRSSDELKLDQKEALTYFQRAVDSGDTWALASLADVYREGVIAPEDVEKASQLYQKSYAGGNEGAYLTETAMLLRSKKPAQQKRGLVMMKAALKQNMPGIVPVWAEANLFGRGVARNPQKGLQVLKEATAKGDIPATFRLAALYIQGYGNTIPKNFSAASKLLKKLEGKAEQSRIDGEWLYMLGAFAESKSQLQSFAAQLRVLSPGNKASLVNRVSWTNQNTYVYVLQDHLKQQGLYKGPVNGQLTKSTAAAMNAVCKKLATDNDLCGNGPLSEQVRPLLSNYLKLG